MIRKIFRLITSVGLGLTLSIATPLSLKAAERIYFIYGPINLSLGIDSLEEFAETGNVNKELAYYFRLAKASPEEQAAFRQALTDRVELQNPVYISRFFNSPMGESILERMGYLLEIQGGRNGKYAIRGALVQAALDEEEGFTLMNFLKKLPTNMQLDLETVQLATTLIGNLERGTGILLEAMENATSEETTEADNIDFSTLPKLNVLGNYGVSERQVWTLTDPNRDRTFDVVVYQPQRLREGKTPVVVISHGLASRPEDFEDHAQHLTSYGYVVALPRHIGSDNLQVEAMLEGYAREIFTVNEFVDRPLDVSFVIDELERRNNREFGGRLDLNNVGVAGHSFGGYTALVLGGAALNFERLEEVCNRRIWGPNLSLLLQCRALALPERNYKLKDERVTAIFAINPVSGNIFDAEGYKTLNIPVLFAAGSSDPATPAAFEQLRAFVWTASQDKYFALVKGQAHVNFSKLDAQATSVLESFDDLTLPDQRIIDKYGNIYLVAFFEYYLQNDQRYAPYLTPAFSRYIRQSPNEIYVVDQEMDDYFSKLYNEHRSSYYRPIYPPNTEE
ncbi:MAG: alpha/beta hydrolase [Microcystaceae cyanobacterium]